MRVTVRVTNPRHRTEVTGTARTDSWQAAATRVYNRHVRVRGTRVEYIAAVERIAPDYYLCTFGYADPRQPRATIVTNRVTVRVESN
jgi:hypothetical protein